MYSFVQLQVGTYEIHVKHASFKEFIAKSVEVHVSSTTEINAKLELGASSEIVTVEASDVQVQTTTAQVGEIVEGTQLRELPLNGENFMGLVVLSPGVSQANGFNSRDKGLTGGADFSVNGNPYNYNLFMVDGVNNNDVGSGRTILVYPSVDAIAEFKMLRNAYGPEYGQATGAIISITTRSGENQFHGGMFYAGRNDKLDANDWFSNNAPNPKRAELRRNDWGYHIAGPVIKNKLWFWWNQEWNREVRGQTVNACVPTVTENGGDFNADVTSALNWLNTDPNLNNPDPTNRRKAADVGAVTTCSALPPATFARSAATTNPWSATSNIPAGLQKSGNAFAIATPDPAGSLVAKYYPNPTQTGATDGFNGASNWFASENGKPS